MKILSIILAQLSRGEFEFTRHALKRVVERNISTQEICEMASKAIVIEDYPDDKYAPSCLLLGFTKRKRPLHIQVSYIDTELVRIITIYEPDPDDWIDFSRRK